MLRLITVFVIVTSLINLFRLSWYLVGADLYAIRRARASKDVSYRPSVSLVVPVHNEGPVIERTLEHMLKVDASAVPRTRPFYRRLVDLVERGVSRGELSQSTLTPRLVK